MEIPECGRNVVNVGRSLGVVKVDDRYRVVLDREVRELLRVEPGDRVLAIPFSEGVLIISLKGKKFHTSLTGSDTRSRTRLPDTYTRRPNPLPILDTGVLFGAADPKDLLMKNPLPI